MINQLWHLFDVSLSDSSKNEPNFFHPVELATDWQFNFELQKAVTDATKGATINHLISTSTLAQPIGPNVSQLGHLRTAMIHHQTNAVDIYNGMFFNSSIPSTLPHAAMETLLSSGTKLSEEQTLIRKKEIEKALHSKPQRGRKRANLNEVERLELTRTRNREHAKSTRIRKKMRYEELLDCESKIKAIEAAQDLEHRRRCCVVTFLSNREQMIRELSLTNTDSDLPLKIASLFQNPTAIYDNGIANGENLSTTGRLQECDRPLFSRTNSVDNSPSTPYKLIHSSCLHDIALSRNGKAIVELDLVHEYNVLQSFVLKIHFAPESDQIRSITIAPVACSHMENFDQFSADIECQQNLDEQISYPSVVSLEVEKDNKKLVDDVGEKQCQCDDGIGVSF